MPMFMQELLTAVELEFRQQYWIIRSSRETNWKAVNRTRVLAKIFHLVGVPKWAVKEARYCLRSRVCKRCAGAEIPCHSLSERLRRGDFNVDS
jgi:hypothetical protein